MPPSSSSSTSLDYYGDSDKMEHSMNQLFLDRVRWNYFMTFNWTHIEKQGTFHVGFQS